MKDARQSPGCGFVLARSPLTDSPSSVRNRRHFPRCGKASLQLVLSNDRRTNNVHLHRSNKSFTLLQASMDFSISAPNNFECYVKKIKCLDNWLKKTRSLTYVSPDLNKKPAHPSCKGGKHLSVHLVWRPRVLVRHRSCTNLGYSQEELTKQTEVILRPSVPEERHCRF